MPQITELFHSTGQSFELTVQNIKVLVLYGLLAVAGVYYLVVALKSMLSTSKGHHIKPQNASFVSEPHKRAEEDASWVR